MLLHESCHFYGLQWLICLFKFSIKPGGTGRIRKGEQCSVVLALQAPRGDIALPDLRSSGYSADSAHSLEQRCGVRPGDSFQTAQEKCKWKYFVSPPDKSFCLFPFICPGRLVKGNALKMSIVRKSMHCIRHKVQFTTHKNSSQSQCDTERKGKKYGARTSLFPGGPLHLLFVRVTDVFQMMVSHVCWTSTKAVPWETVGHYTPSDGGNLCGPNLCAPRLPSGKS